MKHMKISFSVNDWVEQELELITDDYTPKEIFEMLEQGRVLTSIQKGGDLVMVLDGDIVTIGKVISSESGDGTYFDFELLEAE